MPKVVRTENFRLRMALAAAKENAKLYDGQLRAVIEQANRISETVAYWQRQADEIQQMLYEEGRRENA